MCAQYVHHQYQHQKPTLINSKGADTIVTDLQVSHNCMFAPSIVFFFLFLNWIIVHWGLMPHVTLYYQMFCGPNDPPWSRLSSGAWVHHQPGLVKSTQQPLCSLHLFYPSHLTLRGEFEKWQGVIKRLLHGFCANEISSTHEGGWNWMGTRIKCERLWQAVTAELLFVSAPLLQLLPGWVMQG